MTRPIPYPLLQAWKSEVQSLSDGFLTLLPKIELHIHLEGTLTPLLRYTLATRNHLLPLHSARLNKDFHTLSQLEECYHLLEPISIKGSGVSAFFEAYYGGMEVLLCEEDFFDLAYAYFERAKEMNIRYCEVMFDIQAHTRRGIAVETVMNGLERAKVQAEKDLNVRSTYIANFLRDLPLEDALTLYELLKPFKHLIIAIGLDSNEYQNPPEKFYPLFTLAKSEGYHLTCHCDVAQPSTIPNITQVVTNLGERIDHGLDAASSPSLVDLIVQKNIAMTICPWAYVRHHTEERIFGYINELMRKGVKVTVSSDSPAYVEGNWLIENLKLLRLRGEWSDEMFATIMRNAVGACWADEEWKREFEGELDAFSRTWGQEL